MKRLRTEIECKVHDMLPVINDTFVQHEKDMRDIASTGECNNGVSNLSISGDPAGRLGINLTDQHREYLQSKDHIGPCSIVILLTHLYLRASRICSSNHGTV